MVLSCTGAARAQETLVYSFEPDLEGFTGNPAGPAITLSQETSGLGATHGSNSLKVVHARFNGFAGATTQNLPAAFNDPLGLDFLRFDLTLTSRFSPEPTDPPPPDPVPTFADLGVTFFGTLPGNPVPEAQIQYLLAQAEVGDFEAGTHEVEIDLRNDGGDLGTGGGLNTDTGEIKGYDAWIEAGFVPLEFQIYSNKSVSTTNPAFEWTFYIDSIRVGRDVVGVPGDFNEDGAVDAADYVVWRRNENTTNTLPNDNEIGGTIGQAHYDLWRANFGAPGGSGGGADAVPEPASAILLIVASCGLATTRRARLAT